MAQLNKLQLLLNNTEKLLQKKREISIIKGEEFNVFNILKMRTNEVNTHSAFIAELLNPKGTHYMKDTFLKMFMRVIDNKDFLSDTHTTVQIEETIGKIDYEKGIGGRIDILLVDKNNNHIAIENKIYADDGKMQLIRYHNYLKDKNKSKLYYLNLFGQQPDDISIKSDKFSITGEKDFVIISYRNHIIPWLYQCEEKATNNPILRETIKQYRILIQQLTNTLDMSTNNELKEEMFKYLEESKFIANNYYNMIHEIQKEFRNVVYNRLNKELSSEYTLTIDNEIEGKYAQIWIKPNYTTKNNLIFGIETFNGNYNAHKNGMLFVGIKSNGGTVEIDNPNRLNQWWPDYKKLEYKSKTINLSDIFFIKMMISNNANDLVNFIVSKVIEFVRGHKYKIEKQ